MGSPERIKATCCFATVLAVLAWHCRHGELAGYAVAVPAAVAAAGYDRLLVTPLGGDGMFSLGHLAPGPGSP